MMPQESDENTKVTIASSETQKRMPQYYLYQSPVDYYFVEICPYKPLRRKEVPGSLQVPDDRNNKYLKIAKYAI